MARLAECIAVVHIGSTQTTRKTMIAKTLTYSAVFAMALGVGVAQAAQCPETAGTANRVFAVTTSQSICYEQDSGGKIAIAAYSLLDNSDKTGNLYELLLTGTNGLTSGSSGTSMIGPPSSVPNLINFKSGLGQREPDWASFLLPLGNFVGSWSTLGQRILSRVEVRATGVVPIPVSAWLLASGLIGLVAVGRRRKSGPVVAA